MIAWIR
jgi:hydroxyacylglutathione hydrolase